MAFFFVGELSPPLLLPTATVSSARGRPSMACSDFLPRPRLRGDVDAVDDGVTAVASSPPSRIVALLTVAATVSLDPSPSSASSVRLEPTVDLERTLDVDMSRVPERVTG